MFTLSSAAETSVISIPAHAEIEIWNGNTQAILSHDLTDKGAELSVLIREEGTEGLRARIVMHDGQHFAITVRDGEATDPAKTFRFRRNGNAVDLWVPAGSFQVGPASYATRRLWSVQLAAATTRRAATNARRRAMSGLPRDIVQPDSVIVRQEIVNARKLHVAQIEADTRADARRLCSRIIGAGGACIVRRNRILAGAQ